VICALVVAWTAGEPLSVVLGAMEQEPLVSVTMLPETVQVCASALPGRQQAAVRANAASKSRALRQ
jgi:hypothetical protein